jgi:streptomycin 6-kinase
MLKVGVVDEEKLENQLMIWWNGKGAARLIFFPVCWF